MDLSAVYNFIGNSMYGALVLNALWGAYSAIMVWTRVGRKRFRSERQLQEFLDTLTPAVAQGNFENALHACDGDDRVVPQLAQYAIENRNLGLAKAKQMVLDRFQRDVIADLETRLAWVIMMIKTAPMLGLLGTVLGMMAAFGKLSGSESVKPSDLASDIALALITTAMGLTIAIPLMLAVAAINIRMRKMEDLVSIGLGRFFEAFQAGMAIVARRGR